MLNQIILAGKNWTSGVQFYSFYITSTIDRQGPELALWEHFQNLHWIEKSIAMDPEEHL